MTEDEQVQFNAELADPALITTHQRCLDILATLDGEIASIQGQLEAARAEASVAPLSADRQGWLRRAAGALSFKNSDRTRVWMRSKELRGTKGPAQTPPRKDPAESIAKQTRLMSEADARKAKRAADALTAQIRLKEMEAAISWRKHFVAIANERLEPEVFQQWSAEAKKRASPTVS